MEISTAGPLPYRAHPTDAGADLTALTGRTLASGGTSKISTGVRMAIPEGYVGLIFGRSSLGANHGITLANTVGVIDSSYRGEIIIALRNNGRKPYRISPGDRIAQLVILPIVLPAFVSVESLDETERGDGGFGSTGA